MYSQVQFVAHKNIASYVGVQWMTSVYQVSNSEC